MDKKKYMAEKIRNKNMKATPFYAVGVISILISVLIFSDDTLAIPIFIIGVIFLVATILKTNWFVFKQIKDIKKTSTNDSTSVEKKNTESITIPVRNIEVEIKKESPTDKALKRKQNILESIDIKRKVRKI